jgi:S1-C subfamily serine protease
VTAGAVALVAFLAGAAWLLWRPAPGSLDTLTAVARRSVYLVVIQEGERRTPVGTAFAVDGGRLVTNAHVAAPLGALPPGGPREAFVISTDAREPPRRVMAVTLHPSWQPGSVADDVALLAVDGAVTATLTFASDDTIGALSPGDTVAIFGFPAAFTAVDRPHGSLMVNALREVRGRYLVVDIGVTPGASGSPVFTPDGLVVGVIAGSGQLPEVEGMSPGVAVSATVVREAMP